MINLLPQETQTGAKKIYHIRRRIACLLALSLLLIIALVLLVPAFILVSIRSTDAEKLIAIAEAQPITAVSNKAREEIRRVNALSTRLISIVDPNPMVSKVIDVVISLKGDGVSLTRMQYGGSGDMTLRGTAKSREDLLEFLSVLEKRGEFAKVHSPVSNLIDDADVDYVIQLKIAQ